MVPDAQQRGGPDWGELAQIQGWGGLCEQDCVRSGKKEVSEARPALGGLQEWGALEDAG